MICTSKYLLAQPGATSAYAKFAVCGFQCFTSRAKYTQAQNNSMPPFFTSAKKDSTRHIRGENTGVDLHSRNEQMLKMKVIYAEISIVKYL